LSDVSVRQDGNNKRSIALFVPVLDFGGAERQLLELAKGLNKDRWKVVILTNSINPVLSAEINRISCLKVILLDKSNNFLYPFRLLSTLRQERPDILNCYLLVAQAYTLIIRPFLSRTKIIFCIRDAIDYSSSHGVITKLSRLLVEKSSSLIDGYIFNSVAGRNKRGSIPDGKVTVIPNGIDTDKFYPNLSLREFMRKDLGVVDDMPIVGIVSNFSVYKGYETFIRSASIVACRIPGVQFVSIGNYETSLGKKMRSYVHELGLASCFHFLGTRSDVHQLLPGFDVFVSASLTEGFCNAICEGMACGIPCVVTDVGDSAMIVGDTGIVVPPAEPELLADGIMQLLELSHEKRLWLGESARTRIVENFNVPRMVTETENVFERLLCDRNREFDGNNSC
jgi:glycosyltransferase involved in cell wall biosynthesis